MNPIKVSNGKFLVVGGKFIKTSTNKLILPQDCLIIDYLDGVNVVYNDNITISGVEPTSYDYIPKENVLEGSNYFDLSYSPFENLPCGTFDGTNTYLIRTYSGFDLVENNGYTVEFYSRLNGNTWVNQWFTIDNYFHIMREYNTNHFIIGWDDGSYHWDGSSIYINTDFIGFNSNMESWHHYLFTFEKLDRLTKMILYIDGRRYLEKNVNYFSKVNFVNCVRNANSFGNKTGKHQLAKFIVWNKIKYTANFVPETRIEGFGKQL